MKIHDLISKLSDIDLYDDVYVLTGYNRFDIIDIQKKDDYIQIIISEDANNPIPVIEKEVA